MKIKTNHESDLLSFGTKGSTMNTLSSLGQRQIFVDKAFVQGNFVVMNTFSKSNFVISGTWEGSSQAFFDTSLISGIEVAFVTAFQRFVAGFITFNGSCKNKIIILVSKAGIIGSQITTKKLSSEQNLALYFLFLQIMI